jgi:GntR family transcriptional regulator, transcriptional repressor for pyruvate dehydrogenase complex
MRLADRERLASHVFNHLTQQISSGAFDAGEALPSESALAEQYNVSKPVIREALTQLSAFGLLQISQGRPARVRGVNAAPLAEFFRLAMIASGQGLREAVELRRALESQIAVLAAQRRLPEGLAAMAQALAGMQANTGDVARWAESDCAFHLGLAQAAGNRLMLHLMEALTGPIRQTIEIISAQRDLSSDRTATLARHRRIHRAVERGDVAAARAAMANHFAASRPVVDAVLDDPTRLATRRAPKRAAAIPRRRTRTAQEPS